MIYIYNDGSVNAMKEKSKTLEYFLKWEVYHMMGVTIRRSPKMNKAIKE